MIWMLQIKPEDVERFTGILLGLVEHFQMLV